jgi:hypothetical protein
LYIFTLGLIVLTVFITRTWRNWGQYHTTLLYGSSMNLLSYVIMGKDRLWYHIPSSLWNDIADSFVLLPSIFLLYLSFFPKKTNKKWIYYLKWVIGSLIFEWLLVRFGEFGFHEKYHFWMDIPFYFVMYAFIKLHTKRPLLTYGLSILFIALLIICFGYSLEKSNSL